MDRPCHARGLGVRKVSKRFGGHLALGDVTLQFPPGQVLGLAGHNGSGKSTLIKSMAGYHTPEPGAEVVVDGVVSAWREAPEQWGRRLRFLHQDLGLVPSMDAVENFALSSGYARRGLAAIDWRRQRERTAAALERLGAKVDIRVPVSQLAHADRTMLGLARAFSDLPVDGLLVLDEPTAALTAHEALPLFASIRRVVEHGAAVLLVTHHLDELMEHADSIAVLREGRLVRNSPKADLTRADLAAEVAGAPSAPADRGRGSQSAPASLPALHIAELAGGRLRRLSFDARPGRITGIGGLSGSGRDDVASLIIGGQRRASGTVRVAGHDVPSGDPRRAARLGIAHAPAERVARALFPRHSAADNVTVPRLTEFTRGLRVRRTAESRAAREALERADLVPMAPDAPILQFSGGNQQKAVLARCLRTRPEVLVLDEPTQGVDVGGRAVIYELVRQAAAEGAAVVVCSSDDEELAELCDEVIVLVHGDVGAHLEGSSLTPTAVSHASLADGAQLHEE